MPDIHIDLKDDTFHRHQFAKHGFALIKKQQPNDYNKDLTFVSNYMNTALKLAKKYNIYDLLKKTVPSEEPISLFAISAEIEHKIQQRPHIACKIKYEAPREAKSNILYGITIHFDSDLKIVPNDILVRLIDSRDKHRFANHATLYTNSPFHLAMYEKCSKDVLPVPDIPTSTNETEPTTEAASASKT